MGTKLKANGAEMAAEIKTSGASQDKLVVPLTNVWDIQQ